MATHCHTSSRAVVQRVGGPLHNSRIGKHRTGENSRRAPRSVVANGFFRRNTKDAKLEQEKKDWDDVQLRGWVSDESAFDKQAQKCLRLYQSFLMAPGSRVSKAVGGDRESMLLTGLFILFPALFGTVVYIACYM